MWIIYISIGMVFETVNRFLKACFFLFTECVQNKCLRRPSLKNFVFDNPTKPFLEVWIFCLVNWKDIIALTLVIHLFKKDNFYSNTILYLSWILLLK